MSFMPKDFQLPMQIVYIKVNKFNINTQLGLVHCKSQLLLLWLPYLEGNSSSCLYHIIMLYDWLLFVGDTTRCQMKFDDPRVCKSFLLGCCPHDILSSTVGH